MSGFDPRGMPRDLVDVFDGADPGEDAPGVRSFRCEVCGYWNTIEDGLEQYDLTCRFCGDAPVRSSELRFK